MKRKGNAAAAAAQKASGSDTEKKVKERPKKAGPFNLNEEFPAEFAYTPVAGAVLFAVVLTIYILTMHRSVSGGDTGELLGCACELGIAHPPGYPTFTLIAHLFVLFFPVGSPAFRVAIMTGACDALAAVLVMMSTQRWILTSRRGTKLSEDQWEGSLWPSIMAGGLYSLSPLVWMYSVQAEVFAMNNMLAALLIYLIILFNERRTLNLACLGALTIGIGLTNQHTLLLYALPMVVWCFAVERELLLTPRALALLIACGLLGLTPYLFTLFGATYAPLGSWGDTSTISGFMTHFLRKEYGTFQLYSGADKQDSQALLATLRYLKEFVSDSLYIGAILIVSGIGSAAIAHRKDPSSPFLVMTLSWVTYLLVFHSLSNLPIDKLPLFLGIHMRFWMQPHLISFIFLGLGLKPFLNLFSLWRKAAVIPLVILLIALQVGLNYKTMDQSKNDHVMELGKAHLQNLPPNSILISQGDMVTNSMRYLQRCEKYRDDVLLLDETMMTYKWMRERQGPHMKKWNIQFPNQYHSPRPMVENNQVTTYTMEEFLALNGNRPEHPCFKAGAWLGDVMGIAEGGVPSWHLVPVGLVAKIMKKGSDLTPQEFLEWYNKPGLFPKEPDFYAFDDRTWEWLARRIVLEWRAKVAYRFANTAVESGKVEMVQTAETDLRDILRLEEVAHGHETNSYILADLHNALGMLTVRSQEYMDTPDEYLESNRRIKYHFAKFVQLHPDPARTVNGQEHNLVKFLDQSPNYNQPIVPKSQRTSPPPPPPPAVKAGEEAGEGEKKKKKEKKKKEKEEGGAETAGETGEKKEKKKKEKKKKEKKEGKTQEL